MSLTDRLFFVFRCPIAWEKLTGTGAERRCGECQRTVTDLSALSRREADELLRVSGGGVCVRLERDARGNAVHHPDLRALAVAALLAAGCAGGGDTGDSGETGGVGGIQAAGARAGAGEGARAGGGAAARMGAAEEGAEAGAGAGAEARAEAKAGAEAGDGAAPTRHVETPEERERVLARERAALGDLSGTHTMGLIGRASFREDESVLFGSDTPAPGIPSVTALTSEVRIHYVPPPTRRRSR